MNVKNKKYKNKNKRNNWNSKSKRQVKTRDKSQEKNIISKFAILLNIPKKNAKDLLLPILLLLTVLVYFRCVIYS